MPLTVQEYAEQYAAGLRLDLDELNQKFIAVQEGRATQASLLDELSIENSTLKEYQDKFYQLSIMNLELQSELDALQREYFKLKEQKNQTPADERSVATEAK